MNFTKAALSKFLQNTKLNQKAASFVLGNESGDLDSSIGSIIYSFFISLKSQKDDSPVPILNYKSADFSLRPELVAVLDRVNIPKSSLTFIDDLNFSEIKIEEIRLVDHNKLINSQLFLKDYVTEVIDHHFDESNYLSNLKHKKILTVGSVCTLIAELCLEEGQLKDEEIARLLLSVILSDTYNLHPGDRTTEKDVQISKALANVIDPSKPSLEVFNEVFQFVDNAKSSVDSLSTNDLLRKDYKLGDVVTKSNKTIKMGIASAPISFTKFINREATVINELSSYSESNQLDVQDFLNFSFFICY